MRKEVLLTPDEFKKSSYYTIEDTVKHLTEELEMVKLPGVSSDLAMVKKTFDALLYHHYLTTEANRALANAGLPTIAKIEAYRDPNGIKDENPLIQL